MVSHYQGINLKDVKKETDLFEGMKFSKSGDVSQDGCSSLSQWSCQTPNQGPGRKKRRRSPRCKCIAL